MKVIGLFLLFLCAVNCNDIWGSVLTQTKTTAEALDAIEAGVFLARFSFPADECLAKYFGVGNSISPGNVNQNIRWSTWLCSFWNPSEANTTAGNEPDDCKYPGGAVASVLDASIILEIEHNTYAEVSDAEFDQLVFILTQSIQKRGDFTNQQTTAMVNDLENVRSRIVKTGFEDVPCSSSVMTVDWQIGSTTEIDIDMGDQVTFVWGDALSHSVASDDAIVLFGYGSQSMVISSGDDCGVNNATCDILENVNFQFTKVFPGDGTFEIYCANHPATMTTTVNVAGPDISSSSFSDSFSSEDSDSLSTESGSMRLATWFS